MSIREEFEKEIQTKYPRQLAMGKAKSPYALQYDSALWAARWMAERCANIIMKLAPGCDDVADEIRQMAKELS